MTSEDLNSDDPVHTTYTIYRAPNGGDPDRHMFLGHFYDWVEAELNRKGSLHEKEVYLEWKVDEANSSFVTAMGQPNLGSALERGGLIEYEPYSGGDLELKEGTCPGTGRRYYLKYPGRDGQAPLMNVPCPLTKESRRSIEAPSIDCSDPCEGGNHAHAEAPEEGDHSTQRKASEKPEDEEAVTGQPTEECATSETKLYDQKATNEEVLEAFTILGVCPICFLALIIKDETGQVMSKGSLPDDDQRP
ncbi:hypothetical protein QFC24_006398 [Naganishia onofrii]|uniref:Uncharacterized protein n=1 Tax=Naganishia onofrii TaxID=1851511 RepID=A0ACC2X0T8_9TREE|nr:hypothetical protein QFC24_006398 [Naganishia onofrii]